MSNSVHMQTKKSDHKPNSRSSLPPERTRKSRMQKQQQGWKVVCNAGKCAFRLPGEKGVHSFTAENFCLECNPCTCCDRYGCDFFCVLCHNPSEGACRLRPGYTQPLFTESPDPFDFSMVHVAKLDDPFNTDECHTLCALNPHERVENKADSLASPDPQPSIPTQAIYKVDNTQVHRVICLSCQCSDPAGGSKVKNPRWNKFKIGQLNGHLCRVCYVGQTPAQSKYRFLLDPETGKLIKEDISKEEQQALQNKRVVKPRGGKKRKLEQS